MFGMIHVNGLKNVNKLGIASRRIRPLPFVETFPDNRKTIIRHKKKTERSNANFEAISNQIKLQEKCLHQFCEQRCEVIGILNDLKVTINNLIL